MLNFVWSLSLGLLVGICAQTADASEAKEGFGKPALIAKSDLAGFDALPEDRQKLKDGRPVMINSTDGRSYRGTPANGYGVYDFRLPQAGAKVAFMGYGTPLGIAEMPDP
jgi:hypothetical protein